MATLSMGSQDEVPQRENDMYNEAFIQLICWVQHGTSFVLAKIQGQLGFSMRSPEVPDLCKVIHSIVLDFYYESFTLFVNIAKDYPYDEVKPYGVAMPYMQVKDNVVSGLFEH